ncbi:hypothetical protein GIHI108528_11465 [Gillisia hiemivivida]
MKNEKVYNIGSFHELLDQSKYFRKLVQLQEL